MAFNITKTQLNTSVRSSNPDLRYSFETEGLNIYPHMLTKQVGLGKTTANTKLAVSVSETVENGKELLLYLVPNDQVKGFSIGQNNLVKSQSLARMIEETFENESDETYQDRHVLSGGITVTDSAGNPVTESKLVRMDMIFEYVRTEEVPLQDLVDTTVDASLMTKVAVFRFKENRELPQEHVITKSRGKRKAGKVDQE